jgi:microcystin-dependent protein
MGLQSNSPRKSASDEAPGDTSWLDRKVVVTSFVAPIICAAVLYLAGLLPRIFNVFMPAQAVVAFDLEKCPIGWSPFPAAAGRFVLGAGEPASSPEPRPTTHTVMERDGRESVTLVVGQLPPHQHPAGGGLVIERSDLGLSTSITGSTETAGSRAGTVYYGQGPSDADKPVPRGAQIVVRGATGSAGDGKPISTMPPYVGLLYCSKDM